MQQFKAEYTNEALEQFQKPEKPEKKKSN